MKQWLIQTLSPHQPKLALILGLQLLMAVLVAVQPVYMQKLVSTMLNSELANDLVVVIYPAMILIALFVVVAVFQGLTGYISAFFSSDLLKQLQTSFFRKTAELPLNYFHRSSSGEFFTQFNNDIGQAQSFIANIVPTFIREGITVFVLTGVLAWFCPWQLVLTVAAIVGLSVALALRCHRIMEGYAIHQRSGWSEINRLFDETVRGIDTIKTFGAEDRYKNIFQQQTEGFRSLSVKAGKTGSLFSPSIDLVNRLGGISLLIIAYVLIVGNRLGIDTFILFFFCSALLQGSVTSMTYLYMQMPQHLVGIRNLALFFGERGEDAIEGDETQSGKAASIDRSVPIKFNGLHFSYPDGKELYGGKSFDIPANSITLIQGPNGSGKSTLINLLLGFNKPSRGEITIGGVPLSHFTHKELRQKISVVTQYHHIFNGTLRENLLVANASATDDELIDALKLVGLEYLVERHADGLGQVLDSSGRVISGGERQRVCIARILLRKTPVLVLDEPWAHLDDVCCETFRELLGDMKEGMTIVIVSHIGINESNVYDNCLDLQASDCFESRKDKYSLELCV